MRNWLLSILQPCVPFKSMDLAAPQSMQNPIISHSSGGIVDWVAIYVLVTLTHQRVATLEKLHSNLDEMLTPLTHGLEWSISNFGR